MKSILAIFSLSLFLTACGVFGDDGNGGAVTKPDVSQCPEGQVYVEREGCVVREPKADEAS